MTTQKGFKARVRARMAKTGESYAAARRVLLAEPKRPSAGAKRERLAALPGDFVPTVSEAKLVEATGHGWPVWVGRLDAWGAAERGHTATAEWLREEHGVPGWYAQAIAVGFERARGLRAPGQRADGFAVTASRTVAVPVERLFAAFRDARLRARWLPEAPLRARPQRAPEGVRYKTARFDWEDGATRLVVSCEPLGPAKSRVALSHERLPDAAGAEARKLWWREQLGALKRLLEGGSR